MTYFKNKFIFPGQFVMRSCFSVSSRKHESGVVGPIIIYSHLSAEIAFKLHLNYIYDYSLILKKIFVLLNKRLAILVFIDLTFLHNLKCGRKLVSCKFKARLKVKKC